MTKLLISFSLLSIFSCTDSENQVYFKQNTLDSIATLALIEPVPPPFYISAPVYSLSVDDSIVVSNFANLHQVYKANYTKAYPEFSDFLSEVLNHKVKLSTKVQPLSLLYDQKFMLDSSVAKVYKNENLKGLIQEYTLADKNGYKLKSSDLTLNQINTISYYFLLHNYLRQADDYNKSIHYHKISYILNNIGNK